ncbi:MAG: arsenite efflux transporter metallochaperone ArsD [Rhodoferax sp.]|nr:arsenite efflux transporter metallochaperone ArsD [Rhodoferax sp.]MDD5478086.1 arsenite efflux transporter metallochaperone ArsD [Rhodoferax sp.]
MKKLQIFDPALCCSSGVCGTNVDQALVTFSADVDWAKQNGLAVERFNLAQQPMAFADNAIVKALLQQGGEATLPALVADGKLLLSGRYPQRAELAQWMGRTLPVALFTPQVAELVAIGAAIASNCEPCFKHHFDAAYKLGVSTEDMLQAVNLAQQVKDSAARAVHELALRMLEPGAAVAAAAGCCGQNTAKTATSCCNS